ncbi:MAG: prolipoprotein diacylglyceryl transferase [Acidobacteriota bacterium]|nr:prolipoprotein diacylglyceryl transferase [Acidobacteriota bacterium]
MHPILFHIGPVLVPAYGAMAALGVLLALGLAQRTAHSAGIHPNQMWSLCIVALFAALAGSRLLLVIVNWAVVRSHPAWLLGLAMIHHPLLAAAGALLAVAAAALYMRKHHMPLAGTADALAAPLALFLACEQIGALLAGSGYGTETAARWAVTYTSPLAARWSGAPLGVPVHPAQAYAALAFLTISISLLMVLPHRRQQGDIAGLWLMAAGVAIYFTEFWRDTEGRGAILRGALDGPQLAAIAFVLAGALVLRRRKGAGIAGDAATAETPHPVEAPHV